MSKEVGKLKKVFAIFHKYHDGDFPCYGPDGAFFNSLAEAKTVLPRFDGESDEDIATIIPCYMKKRQ